MDSTNQKRLRESMISFLRSHGDAEQVERLQARWDAYDTRNDELSDNVIVTFLAGTLSQLGQKERGYRALLPVVLTEADIALQESDPTNILHAITDSGFEHGLRAHVQDLAPHMQRLLQSCYDLGLEVEAVREKPEDPISLCVYYPPHRQNKTLS